LINTVGIGFARHSSMNNVIAGALAGLAATGPMTALMVGAHEGLPRRERYGLPPEHVAANAAGAAGADEVSAERERRIWATVPMHFGYGAAMGAVYGLIGPRVPGPAPLKGVGFGLAVWAGSYLGLLPVMGLLRPATREPAGRNAMMIAAHVVWGAVAGLLVEQTAPVSGARGWRSRRRGGSGR
jgi:uncharacterized membrane protein YagU involved in acid resistance